MAETQDPSGVSLDVIIERAIRDRNFRVQLLNEPKKALEEHFSVKLPESATLKVLEEAPDRYYLIIPHVENVAEEISPSSGIVGTFGCISEKCSPPSNYCPTKIGFTCPSCK